jgi:hypothetical protein
MSQKPNQNNSHQQNNNQHHKESKSNKDQQSKDQHHHRSLSAPLKNFGRIVKKPLIKEAVKEVTAGGIVYRINKAGVIEVLLAQDSRDRWTIPKGHVESGEITSQTADRTEWGPG